MQEFETYRPLLFSFAYRMTGSAADAEDIEQDAFIAYVTEEGPEGQSIQTRLLSIVARLGQERLEHISALREDYLGPWLPEPLLTSDGLLPSVSAGALPESLTLSYLTALDALNPRERAVYLLHEVFGLDTDRVMEIMDMSVEHCAQVVTGAHARVVERHRSERGDPQDQRRLVEDFLEAVLKGDEKRVQQTLAPDVVYLSDAGGKVVAATRPVSARDSVARLLLGVLRQAPRGASFAFEEINAGPALVCGVRGDVVSVVCFDVLGERIRVLRALLNPDKLMYLRHQMRLREREPDWQHTRA